jgi:hypothetical protein
MQSSKWLARLSMVLPGALVYGVTSVDARWLPHRSLDLSENLMISLDVDIDIDGDDKTALTSRFLCPEPEP